MKTRFRLTMLSLFCLALGAQAQDAEPVRPAALEFSWTPTKMPNGDRVGLLGASYMVAMDENWGIGPAVFGAATGNYGGFFTAGVQAQRRWHLAGPLYLATTLYVGAGGGRSTAEVHTGGGLMLRPELGLRLRTGKGYVGVGYSQVRFPSGTIRDNQLGLSLGLSDDFGSFSPSASGRRAFGGEREGLGFDEFALGGGSEHLVRGRTRAGAARHRGIGRGGAELRQYIGPGAWWGLEGSGAAKGGADGYMELLANIGQDWALGQEKLRLGLQLSAGLGGGGAVDTGSGWLWRAGPTLRWITPWGPSLQILAARMKGRGSYEANQLRVSLAVPLDRPRDPDRLDFGGAVREQTWSLQFPHYPSMPVKGGGRESVTGLGLALQREWSPNWYGTIQAGSAAWGHAGAYSYGLFGAGWKSAALGPFKVGAEVLAGASGGGGINVGSGATTQALLYSQWEGRGERERWRARIGYGRWNARGGPDTPVLQLSLGYAFGVLGQP